MKGETTAPALQVTLSEDGRLVNDLLCAGCGHNLRGLLPESRCVECGLPIHLSRGGSSLGAASPDWIARLRWGTGTFVMLMPWLWVPLVWPAAWWACWRMAEPSPGTQVRTEWPAGLARVTLVLLAIAVGTMVGAYPIARFTLRSPELLLFVVAIVTGMIVCAGLAARRLRARMVHSRSRPFVLLIMRLCAVASVLAIPTLFIDWAPTASDSLVITSRLLAILGVLFLLGCLVALPVRLVRLWRELERAEALTRRAARLRAQPAHPRQTPAPATRSAGPDHVPRTEG